MMCTRPCPHCAEPRIKYSHNSIVRIEGDSAWIDVSTPKFPNVLTVVDADIVDELLSRGRWVAAKMKQCSERLYVTRGVGGRKNRRNESLHRILLALGDSDLQCDHIDGDSLNNRISNLRIATATENKRNRLKYGGTSSRYKGVCIDNDRGLWQVGISVNGKRKALGRFASEEDAARAYDAAAKLHYGKFARLNFPEEHE